MDVRDLFTGRMSWRRFKVVLDRLPIDSEFKTDLRNVTDLSTIPPGKPGTYGPWPQHDMLLAEIRDIASHWMWANADPEKRPSQPPPPYPRPGVEVAEVRAISEEAAAYLEYMRQHRGAAPPDDWKPAMA